MHQFDILLVYDDPHMLRIIELALQDRGCQVSTALSGEEATRLLKKKSFHIVLTDLVMNRADGFSVLKRAKEIDPETMVIMLGCKEDIHYDQEDLPQEADDYVMTPCSIPKLWKRVANCIERLELKSKLLETEERVSKLAGQKTSLSDGILEDIKVRLLSLANEIKELQRGDGDMRNKKAPDKLKAILEKVTGLIARVDKKSTAPS